MPTTLNVRLKHVTNSTLFTGPSMSALANSQREESAIKGAIQGARARRGEADHRLMKLLMAYESSGGLAGSIDVISLLEQRSGHGVGVLARWIVSRAVISVEWQSDTWLPLFQFNASNMTPRPEIAKVVAELAGLFDSWEMAEWFARPNSTLHDQRPADRLQADLPAVLNAARIDRFAALG